MQVFLLPPIEGVTSSHNPNNPQKMKNLKNYDT